MGLRSLVEAFVLCHYFDFCIVFVLFSYFLLLLLVLLQYYYSPGAVIIK